MSSTATKPKAAPKVVKKITKKMNVADNYEILTDLEHVLKRPDTYVGSCELIEDDIFIADVDSDTPKIIKKKITYVQALERCYEELLLNSFDRTVVENTGCTEIRVDIDQESGTISITNNGNGIPVVMKEELNCYLPEMILGMLRTGSNYDDTKERITGGKNGFGAKLANIFSKAFTLETIDADTKKHYVQTWTNNMSEKSAPVIKKSTKKPFTKITFVPDLARFNIAALSTDIVMLMKKRLIDIGYVSHVKVKTFYNGNSFSIKKPEDYMKLYTHPEGAKFIVDDTCERWSVGVALSRNGFQHASFVNGVHTTLGGSHVDHVVSQIVKVIIEKLKKKIDLKPSDVKNKMFLFLRSTIVNPAFDSQSKECLKMTKTKFGSEYIMNAAFKKALLASDICKSMSEVFDAKSKKDLEKTSGVKKTRLTGMVTLEDANFAGTSKALSAKLILTEGLSARTFAISALNVIGRNCYGVFPLKGKPLNVRDAELKAVVKNEEIQSVVKILGLKYELTYESDADMKTLRYGGVISLSDADVDGIHICGLTLNFFSYFWPHLVARKYVSFCITPIVKVYKGPKVFEFYTLNSYEEWIASAKGQFTTKYFKGLGTSTAKEAREALADIDQKLITFESDDKCEEHLSMAFNKKRTDDRKTWLMERYDATASIDRKQRNVAVSDFINYELSHFSTYDCARSIPCIMDGLKPSQRKIMYTAMKYAAKNEIKVAQFAPKVAEMTDYHHGEVSLMGAIIGMAQDYVGSNNINLLEPRGAFGSRISNGKDAASPRYIFTRLNPIAMKIFDQRDSCLLNYLVSDGMTIEPEWFAPVLPMIIINGTNGIGTGFSSSVLQYNPKNVAQYIKQMLTGPKPAKNLLPWYRGFTGVVEKLASDKFVTYGVWTFDDRKKTLRITELPIGTSTDKYKEFCEKLLAASDSPLTEVIYNTTDVVVDITLFFSASEYRRFNEMERDILAKTLKLRTPLNSSNMYLFNAQGIIQKYPNVYSIIKYFHKYRLALYVKRKEAMIEQLKYEMLILLNKARFIRAVKQGDINQRTMTEESLLKTLTAGYDANPRSTGSGITTYDYLVSMGYRSFTNENAARMDALLKDKEDEIKNLKATTPETMWSDDLDAIIEMLD